MPSSTLVGDRRLATNVWLNFLGQGLPLLAGLAAIPTLIRILGTERFGILTLVWVVVGYLSLFDFGVGRALTKLVAERLGDRRLEEVPGLIWAAILLVCAFGGVGALLLAALSRWLSGSALTIPEPLQAETTVAFYVLALLLPVMIAATALRGVLEAYQRFDIVAAIRVPTGLWTYLGPLAAAVVSPNLVPVMVVLALGRLLALAGYFVCCVLLVPALRQGPRCASIADARVLASFGGWLSVSNVLGPLMVYLDRFVIGTLLTMSAVAYYATPYEIVTRLWLIPAAIVGVLFPAMSATLSQDRLRAGRLAIRGTGYILMLLFPISLVLVGFAEEGLALWLGAEFAARSAPVLQWLAIGVLINSLAWVPLGLLQADGRPDLVAKLHVIELPIYVFLLFSLLEAHGIVGAAIAWFARVTFDAVVLYWLAVPRTGASLSDFRPLAHIGLVAGVGLGLSWLADSTANRAVILTLSLAVFVLAAWRTLLSEVERQWLMARFMP